MSSTRARGGIDKGLMSFNDPGSAFYEICFLKYWESTTHDIGKFHPKMTQYRALWLSIFFGFAHLTQTI